MQANITIWLIEGEQGCLCGLSHGQSAVVVTGGGGSPLLPGQVVL